MRPWLPPRGSTAEDLARRKSYTDHLVLTIDPETAKDFDDAVSLQMDDSGYHLQVHIADVSWFVAEDGALDREACRRGKQRLLPGVRDPHASRGAFDAGREPPSGRSAAGADRRDRPRPGRGDAGSEAP